MASKHSRSAPAATIAAENSPRAEVERLIAKERFKDAVKQAKICYKTDGSPANHCLLERTYFLRARQLSGLGMKSSAIEVCQHLLEFGVTQSNWIEEFVQLLIDLGLNAQAFEIQARLGRPELTTQLLAMSADLAVINPGRDVSIAPEISREATVVRQSLERLQSGDEPGALMLVRELPRSSILSDWKFFIRGLAAYQRGQTDDARSNWERLDPARKPRLIAERLEDLGRGHQFASPGGASLDVLETAVFGEPVLERLNQLRGFAAQQDWDQVIRVLGPLRRALGRISPALPARLTAALLGPIYKQATRLSLSRAERLIGAFANAAEPLAIDPRWNRLWGLLWDEPQAGRGGAESYWLLFLDDLKTNLSLDPKESRLAQAMVWNRIAEIHDEHAEELADADGADDMPLPPRVRDVDQRDVDLLRKRVIECLNQSLELAPLHLPTYHLLVDMVEGWHQPDLLQSAAERLLAVFPDDLDTLSLLADLHNRRNNPAAALPYIERLRKIKPLDQSLRELECTIRLGVARAHALAQRFDDGRAQFAAAENLVPECRRNFHYLATRVIFETKAGNSAESDRFLRDAQAVLREPTALWLALAIESNRFRLTKGTQENYQDLWIKDLKKKSRSETAAQMAMLLEKFMNAGIEYPRLSTHIKHLVAYIKRTARLKFTRADIEQVATFLARLPRQTKLTHELINAGLKKYPESATLHFRAGIVAMELIMSPASAAKAHAHFETAIKLAEASSDPKDAELLPRIKELLTTLNEFGTRMMSPRFDFDPRDPASDGSFRDPFQSFSIDEFLDDDDEDDDRDDDDESVPNPSNAQRPSRPSKKKTSTRKKR